jgi:deoxyribose-phosphate aldolase
MAARIDHTVLKSDATLDDIARLCDEVLEYGFATVCTNAVWVPEIKRRVGDAVPICTVVGFPLGATATEAKAAAARRALDDGASELDMVLQVGLLRSAIPDKGNGEWDARLLAAVKADVAAVARVVHPRTRRKDRALKVILECGLLSKRQVVAAALLAEAAGADFVKTSTGFFGRGASVADVKLLRSAVTPRTLVKASAGIRTARQACALLAAGADRLGSSSGVAIVEGL